MDGYSSYHELQFQQSSSSDQGYYPFPSSSSSPPSCASTNRLTFSDEDNIQLASTNPKKRAGRKKFKETRHPIYRGVRQRNSGKWVCEVREPTNQKRIWLGTFPTVEMAARAHDVAAMALRGRSACLNFADSAWRLPVPASSDTKDIQKAAAEAAECFRPQGNGVVTTSTPVEGQEKGEIVVELEEEAAESYQSVTPTPFYMDEEDVFHMPALLADMYDGLMIPPPSYSSEYAVDDSQGLDFDLPLWSYSA